MANTITINGDFWVNGDFNFQHLQCLVNDRNTWRISFMHKPNHENNEKTEWFRGSGRMARVR